MFSELISHEFSHLSVKAGSFEFQLHEFLVEEFGGQAMCVSEFLIESTPNKFTHFLTKIENLRS